MAKAKKTTTNVSSTLIAPAALVADGEGEVEGGELTVPLLIVTVVTMLSTDVLVEVRVSTKVSSEVELVEVGARQGFQSPSIGFASSGPKIRGVVCEIQDPNVGCSSLSVVGVT